MKIKNKELSQCKKRTIKNKILATSKGIKIGDSPDKIITVYGEPHKREIEDGMLVFEYHTDYREDPRVRLSYDAYLYFKEDRLVKLVIHDGL